MECSGFVYSLFGTFRSPTAKIGQKGEWLSKAKIPIPYSTENKFSRLKHYTHGFDRGVC